MKCLVRNQDGIEETVDASVIRLEPTDVIVVNTNDRKVLETIAEVFNQNIVVQDYKHNITIIKNARANVEIEDRRSEPDETI